jgi:hypothetical protein
MGIVKISENNPYKEYLYDKLDWIFDTGTKYLPFIFLKSYYFTGDPHEYRLPRWITKREWDSIDKKAQKLADSIKWE